MNRCGSYILCMNNSLIYGSNTIIIGTPYDNIIGVLRCCCHLNRLPLSHIHCKGSLIRRKTCDLCDLRSLYNVCIIAFFIGIACLKKRTSGHAVRDRFINRLCLITIPEGEQSLFGQRIIILAIALIPDAWNNSVYLAGSVDNF